MTKEKRFFQSKSRRALLLAIGAVLVTVGGIIINFGMQDRTDAIMTLEGKLMPFDVDMTKPFTVVFGGNTFTKDAAFLKSGFDLNSFIDFGVQYPVKIDFNDRQIFVTTEIKNSQNVTIADITENQWAISPDPLLVRDRNYNAYAFEVLEKFGSEIAPALQIRVAPQNKIIINCISYTPTGILSVTLNGGIGQFIPENVSQAMPLIFVYPSKDNLGKMIDPTLPATDPLGPANGKIILGACTLTIGTILIGLFGAETYIVTRKRTVYVVLEKNSIKHIIAKPSRFDELRKQDKEKRKGKKGKKG